jgi:hypothetical protein
MPCFRGATHVVNDSVLIEGVVQQAKRDDSARRVCRVSGWTVSKFLSSLGTGAVLEAALLAPLGACADETQHYVYLRTLGGLPQPERQKVLRLLLAERLDTLAEALSDGVAALQPDDRSMRVRTDGRTRFADDDAEDAARASRRSGRFAEQAEVLSFGGLSEFFGGLELLVGTPHPSVLEAIEREHCAAADSSEPYVSLNYGVTTSSEQEYFFVADPVAGLEKLGIAAFPSEPKPEDGLERAASFVPRVAHPMSVFSRKILGRNDELKQLGTDGLLDAEFVAARLYTGRAARPEPWPIARLTRRRNAACRPMYLKYNTALRASGDSSAAARRKHEERCRGNRYVTTIHAISSAILKLGKLTVATPVYRGIKGATLPKQFFEPDKFNVRCGVERGFMSTTADRSVALEYVTRSNAARCVAPVYRAANVAAGTPAVLRPPSPSCSSCRWG